MGNIMYTVEFVTSDGKNYKMSTTNFSRHIINNLAVQVAADNEMNYEESFRFINFISKELQNYTLTGIEIPLEEHMDELLEEFRMKYKNA